MACALDMCYRVHQPDVQGGSDAQIKNTLRSFCIFYVVVASAIIFYSDMFHQWERRHRVRVVGYDLSSMPRGREEEGRARSGGYKTLSFSRVEGGWSGGGLEDMITRSRLRPCLYILNII